MKARNIYIRLGCFLTGINYDILIGCSELSVKRLLRYTSAILIVCLLWAFIGYSFANRYLKTDLSYSLIAAIISVFIIIQIERQIILTHGTNKVSFFMRSIIAFSMAIIGSVIIDQIILKEDIEQQKIIMLDEKVRRVFPARAELLRGQIDEIDSAILFKEIERKELIKEISDFPTITIYNRKIERQENAGLPDSLSRRTIKSTSSSSQIENPKITLLEPLDLQIQNLRGEKLKKDSLILVLRPVVEAELMANVGFLDELNLTISLFQESKVAFMVWLLWFLLLFGLELFILANKWGDSETDYDAMIKRQAEIHFKRIELLGKH
jgi:hypothetical protein